MNLTKKGVNLKVSSTIIVEFLICKFSWPILSIVVHFSLAKIELNLIAAVRGYSVFASSSSFLIRQGNSGKDRRFPFAYLEIATRLFTLAASVLKTILPVMILS